MPSGRLVPKQGVVAEVIDDTLDDESPTYRLGAACSNCGWNGEVRRTKGYEPRPVSTCPRCECRTVRPNHQWRGDD